MKDEILKLLDKNASLDEFINYLKDLKNLGIEKTLVYNALEDIRANLYNEEEKEDRILEVMDIVYGFCSPDRTIWD